MDTKESLHTSTLINNRDRAKQILSFDGMQYGRCRPTDIDLSMDFQGRVFVFVELKLDSVPLTLGQQIHLQALVDAIVAGGRKAVAILAHHDARNPEGDVEARVARVVKVYTGEKKGQWTLPERKIPLDEYITLYYTEHKTTGVSL